MVFYFVKKHQERSQKNLCSQYYAYMREHLHNLHVEVINIKCK